MRPSSLAIGFVLFVLLACGCRLSPSKPVACSGFSKESGFGQGTFTVKVQSKLLWKSCADGNERDVTCAVDDAKYKCTCHVGTRTYQSFDWDQKLPEKEPEAIAMANGGCGWGTVQSSR